MTRDSVYEYFLPYVAVDPLFFWPILLVGYTYYLSEAKAAKTYVQCSQDTWIVDPNIAAKW